jgi:hypothetical protein
MPILLTAKCSFICLFTYHVATEDVKLITYVYLERRGGERQYGPILRVC